MLEVKSRHRDVERAKGKLLSAKGARTLVVNVEAVESCVMERSRFWWWFTGG
jgi:hypothetical protein